MSSILQSPIEKKISLIIIVLVSFFSLALLHGVVVERDITQVEIADDGGGIPPDIREDLFEPGVHGSDSSGDGIGLYLVGKLVDAYGGRVAVSDRSPSGTRFSFRFPPAPSDADRSR